MSLSKKILPLSLLTLLLMIGEIHAQQSKLVTELQDIGFKTMDAMSMSNKIMEFERSFEHSGILSIIREKNIYFDVFQCHKAHLLLDKYEPIANMLNKLGFTEKKLLKAKILHFMRIHKYVQKTETRIQETERYRTKKLNQQIDKYVEDFPDKSNFWEAYRQAVGESVKLSSREYHKTKQDATFVEKARILLRKYNADKTNIDQMLGSIKEGNNGVAIKIQLIGWQNDQRIKSGL